MLTSAGGKLKKIATVIVDDNAAFLNSVSNLLESWGRFEVVRVASSYHDAIAAVEELEPQLVLLDLVMPETNGFSLTRRMKSVSAPPKVIILTLADHPSYTEHAHEAGADGIVSKYELAEKLPPLVKSLFG